MYRTSERVCNKNAGINEEAIRKPTPTPQTINPTPTRPSTPSHITTRPCPIPHSIAFPVHCHHAHYAHDHSLLLGSHNHTLVGILLHHHLLPCVFLALLLGLNQRAAHAAARLEHIHHARTLEVVLLADVLHLHGLHGAGGARDAAREPEAYALRR
jgi:hypothetical protein